MCSGKYSRNYSKDSCCQQLLGLYPQVSALYGDCPKGNLSDLLTLLANYIGPVYDSAKCGSVFCCQGIVNAYLCAIEVYMGDDSTSLCQLGTVLGCILSRAGFTIPVLNPGTLILDNGVVNSGLGIGLQQWVWLNRFTPSSYPFVLEEIQVYFATTIFGPTNVLVGDPFDLYVWENPSGNVDPGDGDVFRGSLLGQPVQVLNAFNSYPLSSAITFNGPGDILIGVVNRLPLTDPRYGSPYIPACSNNTALQNRSWYGSNYPLNTAPNPPTLPALVWQAELKNWMIRGIGCGGSQILQL